MKRLAIVTAIIFSASGTFAQETGKTDIKPAMQHVAHKNEIGIILQSDFGGNNYSNVGLQGIQYNRWVTPNLGYRIIAAHGNYQQYGNTNTFAPHPDTIITKQQMMNFSMPVIGFGLMAQRHFYKRIFLYAAVEVKGMYNEGDADTLVRTTIRQGAGNPSGSEEFARIEDKKIASMLMINMTASVGAKFQFSRLAFGVELMPVQLGYQNIRYDNKGSGVGDFNLGNFSQRLFINYRFK